jgi:hypothetical protein
MKLRFIMMISAFGRKSFRENLKFWIINYDCWEDKTEDEYDDDDETEDDDDETEDDDDEYDEERDQAEQEREEDEEQEREEAIERFQLHREQQL